MQHVNELMELLTSKLEMVSSSDAVVGEPIELGGVTIVPLTRISLGFGAGGGEGEGTGIGPHGGGPASKRKATGKGKGVGGASGGGAKARPVGVAVFSDAGVEIFPIADKKGMLDKIFDKLPEVMELAKDFQSR